MICKQPLVHSSVGSYGLLLSLLLFSVKVSPLLGLIRKSDIIGMLMFRFELLHNRGVGGFFSAAAKDLVKLGSSSSAVSSAGRKILQSCFLDLV